MKKIYIVLTYTGTLLSKIIKFYTKKVYSHSSIALDDGLDEMYSFGRLNPYNAFIGGFVHESINDGTFKRFKKTKAIVYSCEITDNQYDEIKKTIEYIKKNKESYRFNMIGLFLVSINKRRVKKRTFYCAEFVRHVLQKAKIGQNLPKVIEPEDFKSLSGLNIEYEGLLHNYPKPKIMLEK